MKPHGSWRAPNPTGRLSSSGGRARRTRAKMKPEARRPRNAKDSRQPERPGEPGADSASRSQGEPACPHPDPELPASELPDESLSLCKQPGTWRLPAALGSRCTPDPRPLAQAWPREVPAVIYCGGLPRLEEHPGEQGEPQSVGGWGMPREAGQREALQGGWSQPCAVGGQGEDTLGGGGVCARKVSQPGARGK